jgi:hypothetical protein
MAVLYPSFEFWLLIPKGIEIILFLVLAFKISAHQKYTLNKLFSAALFVWGVYIIIDSIVWITAANSDQAYNIVRYLRDISIYLAISMSFLVFLTSKVIQQGENVLKSKSVMIVGITFVIFAILFNLNDDLVVINQIGGIIEPINFPPEEPVQVIYQITPWTIAGSLIPLLTYFYSVGILIIIAKKTAEKSSVLKMWKIIFGISMIPSGMIYFILLGLFATPDIITASIGHIIWMLAAIFIWLSQKHK